MLVVVSPLKRLVRVPVNTIDMMTSLLTFQKLRTRTQIRTERRFIYIDALQSFQNQMSGVKDTFFRITVNMTCFITVDKFPNQAPNLT